MNGMKRILILSLSIVLASTIAFAQGTTGALVGTVTNDGVPLSGVTISITSEVMPGARTSTSNVNGDYRFSALRPGVYEVTFEMDGMQALTKSARVSLALTERVDIVMTRAGVAEAMTVTTATHSAIEAAGAQAAFDADTIDNLVIGRTIPDVLALAPGVATPAGWQLASYSIRGGFPYDSLYLVNGAVTNDNIFGEPYNLYVPDAVQETTILTGLVSAEYGRFTGGVVSAITKSGGNDFSGSVRGTESDNGRWFLNKQTGIEKERETFRSGEATLGGHLVRERLWFFGAGRYNEGKQNERFIFSNELMPTAIGKDKRFELKLTGQISATQSMVGTYQFYELDLSQICGFGCWETSVIDASRQLPQQIITANYNGILTSDILIEAGYSSREYSVENSGSDHQTTDYSDPRDIALGSWGRDLNTRAFWGSPVFCGVCDGGLNEQKDNEYVNLKGTYYLATPGAGTHTIMVGYENFAESRKSNFYQSGSSLGIFVYSMPTRVGSASNPDSLRPIITYGDVIAWFPIDTPSLGSDFTTESLFLNDEWTLGAKWSFNVGVRYDRNDGTDSAGQPISDTSRVSPRLGAVYDLRGDGRFRVNMSYGRYVSKIMEGVGGDAGGGVASAYYYSYTGATIGGPDTDLSSFDVLEQAWTWLLAEGWSPETPLAPATFRGGDIPSVNLRYPGDLESQHVDEVTIGISTQLGLRGFLRLDLIDREWGNFYTVSTTPGDTVDVLGRKLDVLTHLNCSSCMERTYQAAQVQGSYRFTDRLTLGGNYTWSKLEGNYFGQTSGSGPVPAEPSRYPEYRDFARNNPVGLLDADRTHKATVWLSWDQPLGRFGSLNVSLLEKYYSGAPYSAFSQVFVLPYVENPGYAAPPFGATYYFSDRGEYRWDDVTSTDVSFNYQLPIGQMSMFIQFQVGNVFDEKAQVYGDTSATAFNPFSAPDLELFDPFTETPVEGVHWRKGANFGKATRKNHYQQERFYVASAGFRF